MSRKRILAIVAVVALVALPGCSNLSGNGQGGGAADGADQLAEDAGQNVDNVSIGSSYYYEVKITEKNQMGLVQAQPPFTMDNSLERQNLIRRYKYLNDRTNQHHVYLIDEGQVVDYYVAQGKVSSVNSKLTNDVQIVRAEGCQYRDDADGAAGAEGSCYKTVESPQMDGSYGTNGDAIFFFTTDGAYVESSLDYVVSEEPKNIQDEVLLVDQPDDEEDDE